RILPLGSSAANMESWTQKLLELRAVRNAYALGGDLQQMVHDGSDIEEIVTVVSDRILTSRGTVKPFEIGGVVSEMLDDLRERRKSGMAGTIRMGLSTGIYEVDQATGGLEDDLF